jgi:hypothetical protein
MVPVVGALVLMAWSTAAAAAPTSGIPSTKMTLSPRRLPSMPAAPRNAKPGHRFTVVDPIVPFHRSATNTNAAAQAPSPSILPTATPFFVQAQNYPAGNPYTYQMLGGNPFTSGAGTTTITTPIIPIQIVSSSGPVQSDASATATDCSQTQSPASLVQKSPLFQNQTTDPEGTKTQYIDALQRGNFNQQTKPGGVSPNYHLLFSATTLETLQVVVPAADIYLHVPGNNCGTLTGIDFNWFMQNLPSIFFSVEHNVFNPTDVVHANQLPIFVLYNTVLCSTSACNSVASGYHPYVTSFEGSLVPAAISDYDLTGDLAGGVTDVGSLSHEMAEAVNDPAGNNPAPTWGHIGQTQGLCQQNLEASDPLSAGFTGSPGLVAESYTLNSVSYTFHLQDAAYHSWFFREASPPTSTNDSTALGTGKYSMFGRFATASDTSVCPPQPVGLQVSPGNGQVTLSWTAGTGPVDKYTIVEYINGTPVGAGTLNSAVTAVNFTGLTNGTTYTFTVLADHANAGAGTCPINGFFNGLNIAGEDCSTESLPSVSVTPGTPTAPTNVTASAVGGGAKVSWTAPAQNNGSPVSGYVIMPFLNGAALPPDPFNNNLATTQTITGLTKGQNYTFKVAAINGVGTGTNSASSNTVKPK